MAIERRACERNVDRGAIRRERDDRAPLLRRMGSVWDVANAAERTPRGVHAQCRAARPPSIG